MLISTHGKIWCLWTSLNSIHYSDVIMDMMASQITSLTIVYSTVYLGTDQRKHQSSASLACVWGIHWWPVNSPHKWLVTRKMFPFDDVIMRKDTLLLAEWSTSHELYKWFSCGLLCCVILSVFIGVVWSIYLWPSLLPLEQSYKFLPSHWGDHIPNIKIHGANMGPIWGREDPGGPHVGPMDLAIWVWLIQWQRRNYEE